MNYQKIYNLLIAKAQARATVDGYKERHHIVPRSLGGSDDKSNLVELTAREHFVAHMCLALIYGGTQWLTIRYMKGLGSYSNGRLFEIARVSGNKILKGHEVSKEARIKIGLGNSAALKGRAIPLEVKEKMSKASVGVKKSKEHSLNISKGKKGRSMSKASIEKMSISKTGTKQTEAHVKNAKAARAKSVFSKQCIKLNNLIDSIFQPSAVGC